MNGEKTIEMPETQGRAQTIKPTPKSVKNVSRVSKTVKKVAQPSIPTPPTENTTTTATRTAAEKAFDFDIERAVVEAEILKPKYLDY